MNGFIAARLRTAAALAGDAATHPGAAVLEGGARPPAAFPPGSVQAPLAAAADLPRLYGDGCMVEQYETEPRACRYGAAAGPLLALVGDSHAAQWLPALEAAARRRGWRILTMTKSRCPFIADAALLSRLAMPYAAPCARWNEAALAQLLKAGPDLVVTSMARYRVDGRSVPDSAPLLAAGLARTWSLLQAHGIGVVAIAATPEFPVNVADCLAFRPDHPEACGSPRRTSFLPGDALGAAARDSPGVMLADLTPWLCPGEVCPAVLGNLIVLRDRSHITASYAATIGGALEGVLAPALAARRASPAPQPAAPPAEPR
ncbi:MAG: SGNH hydrolase domain-containing protein [Dongiaceae bacterium]